MSVGGGSVGRMKAGVNTLNYLALDACERDSGGIKPGWLERSWQLAWALRQVPAYDESTKWL